MYAIKEFNKDYNKKVNDFIISIYVDEFGFEQSRNVLNCYNNDIFNDSSGKLWMALNDKDEIVGTIAVFKHDSSNAELKKFYVRNDYRGSAVSKALYNTLLDFCVCNNFTKLSLWTYDNLLAAINFSTKQGFVEKPYNENNSSVKYFELDLSG